MKIACLAATMAAAAVAQDVTTPEVPAEAFATAEVEGNERFVLKELYSMKVEPGSDAEGLAEFFVFNKDLNELVVVNSGTDSVDFYSLASNGTVTKNGTFAPEGKPNSIAYNARDQVLAVAVADAVQTEGGNIVFLDATTREVIETVPTGNPLPDHVSFGPGDSCAYSANEGEPTDDVDPFGGVTQVCATDFKDKATFVVSHSDLENLDAAVVAKLDAAGSGAHRPTLDEPITRSLEPEYITYSTPAEDGSYEVYVICQEANTFLVYQGNSDGSLALGEAPVRIMPLGYKDHSLEGNGIDLINNDKAEIVPEMNLFAMFQPDTVKFVAQGDDGYIVTANEGDQFEGKLHEEVMLEVKDLPTELTVSDALSGFEVTASEGREADGNYTAFYAFGGRSFSVWNAKTGALAFDSGDQFAQMMDKYAAPFFNIKDGVIGKEKRSNKKGSEPESLAAGEIGDAKLLFVGLERPGLITVYDITDVTKPIFHSINGLATDCAVDTTASMVDPEAMTFVAAADSPTGKPLLLAAGSVSSSIHVFEVALETVDDLTVCGRLATGGDDDEGDDDEGDDDEGGDDDDDDDDDDSAASPLAAGLVLVAAAAATAM